MGPDLQPYSSAEHQPFKLGTGEDGALLIHGFPGTPAEVRPIGEFLAHNGWQVVAPLLPGFGSDIVHLNQRRRTDWIESVTQAWQSMQASCKPRMIVGYSMGAALAMQIAAQFQPERLVLISPFWRAPGLVHLLLPAARLLVPNLRLFKKADFNDPRLRQMFATIVPDADLDDPEVQEYIRNRFSLPLAAMQEVLRLGRGAYRRVNTIQSHTLILQGVNDPIVRKAKTRRLVMRMVKARVIYHEIEAGHDLLVAGTAQLEQVVNDLVAFAGQRELPPPISIQPGLPIEILTGSRRS